MADFAIAGPVRCARCSSELAPNFLACPTCGTLVHANQLRELAAEAERAEAANEFTSALIAWRRALELLPSQSKQYTHIAARIEELTKSVDGPAPASKQRPQWTKRLGILGGAAFLVWKLKFVFVLLLTKGKLLLLGLTKVSTLFSLFLSMGLYWSLFGWKWAVGVLLSIYVHEMGHVAALSRYGIRATAPMFIPGFGAVVRLNQRLTNVREDARVGLAGPLWGTVAAVITYVIGYALDWPTWSAVAHVAAWINLFNLLPVWQLDGSRGFAAMTRWQRGLATLSIAVMWFVSRQDLLLLLLAVAGYRAIKKDEAPEKPDHGALALYAGLVVVLVVLEMLTPDASALRR